MCVGDWRTHAQTQMCACECRWEEGKRPACRTSPVRIQLPKGNTAPRKKPNLFIQNESQRDINTIWYRNIFTKSWPLRASKRQSRTQEWRRVWRSLQKGDKCAQPVRKRTSGSRRRRPRSRCGRDGREPTRIHRLTRAGGLSQRRRSAEGGTAQSHDLLRTAAERTFGSKTPRMERDSEDGSLFSC
jgi:hypothetical protein